MKNLVKSIAIVVLTVGTISISKAQKIAHISSDSLITSMAEAKTAEQLILDYQKQLEKQILEMQTEGQSKVAEYQKLGPEIAAIIKANKEQEIQDIQQRIQDFQQQAQQEYQRKMEEIMKPIREKAKKAIELVAKENGYKYVLETSTGNVLYSEEVDNIFQLVKKKLDTMPAVQLPGVQQNKTGIKNTPVSPKTAK